MVIVHDDDDGLYETLYHDLFFVLQQSPGLDLVADEIRDLVWDADSLPSFTDGAAYDQEIEAAIFDNLRRARNILNRRSIADGEAGFGTTICVDGHIEEMSPTQFLFSIFDDEIQFRTEQAGRNARAAAVRLGIVKAPKPEPAAPAKGRPKGSTYLTLKEVKVKLRAFRADGHALDKPAFIVYCGISNATWDRYMAEWNTNWTAFVRESG